MFRNSYQSGLLSIFYSCGAHPLAIWDMEVNNGHIKRLTDNEVNSIVLEIVSTNVATTYITCPPKNQSLGIKLPFLVMILKNLKRYFSFEITILDDKNMRRRFRISNFQSTTKIKPFCTTMPIGLSGGWNQIQFNLSDFTRLAYGSQFIETLRVQVHANVRLRRIYFAERLYTEEELPQDYKLYLPLDKKVKKEKKGPVPPEAATGDAPLAEATIPLEPEVPLVAEAPPVPELGRKSTTQRRKSTTADARKSTASRSIAGSRKDTIVPTPSEHTEQIPQEEVREADQEEYEEGAVVTPVATPEGELAVEQEEERPETPVETPTEAPTEVPTEAPTDTPEEIPEEDVFEAENPGEF